MTHPFRLSLWIALVIFCMLITWELVQQGRARFASQDPNQIALAQLLDPKQSDYQKAQGDMWFRISIPPKAVRAEESYRKAIRLNPLDAIHWADWAEVNWRLGKDENAERAYAIAETLDSNNFQVQLGLGDLLLDQGNVGAASAHYARAAQLKPSLSRAICALYAGIGWSPVKVARTFLGDNPELLRPYWRDCLNWATPEEAQDLWDILAVMPKETLDAACYNAYFNFLVVNRKYTLAKRLWQQVVTSFYANSPAEKTGQDSMFWNGEFNISPAFVGGLEWQISKNLPSGVQSVFSSNRGVVPNTCLWIHFDGKENVSFYHVRHFFFVEPEKKYRLNYDACSLDITTDNGPYVKITVHGETRIVKKGQTITGTGDRKLTEEFEVPAGGQWAEITICRDKSNKLNNRIKGDVWFDSFVLEEAPAEPDLSNVQQATLSLGEFPEETRTDI